MKLRLKTSTMHEMVTKVTKGATNNKMIPLTGLLSIVLNSGSLRMTTTDAVNFFTIMEAPVEGEDFAVVVKVDLFSKLVSKTTSDFITLELDGNTLKFTGNGTYKIDLPLDEEGRLIKFPECSLGEGEHEKGLIKLSTVKSAILSNKPALATTMEAPYLTGYYCTPDSIISADRLNICVNTVKTFPKNVLISSIVFDLLAMSDSEDISYEFNFDKDQVLFTTPKMCLMAKLMKGVEEYPVEPIQGFMECEFPSSCVLPKTFLVNVLDRLSLFISDFDVNGVYLTFTTDGLRIASTKHTASELIPYQSSNNFTPFTCLACVDSFKKQIQARSGETVTLYYGIPDVIKLVDNNVVQILALLEDDRVED